PGRAPRGPARAPMIDDFLSWFHPPPGNVRLDKELAQGFPHAFRPAASVAIARGAMTESGKLDPRDMWQDLLQCVKCCLQVGRALASAEQQDRGAACFEPLESALDRKSTRLNSS